MINPSILSNYFVSYFVNNELFEDITFVAGYTDMIKNSPLPEPTVAMGIERFEDRMVSPVYDLDGTVLLYNRVCEVKMTFNIYVPVRTKGMNTLSIFNRIASELMEKNHSFPVCEVGCGNIKFARDEGALILEAWAIIKDTSIYEQPSATTD